MNKDEFKKLFHKALEMAAKNAETKLGRSVPRTFEIEMHGLSPCTRTVKEDEALEEIYIGPEKFYRIIDIAVRRVGNEVCTIFLRISGHSPSPFHGTWNQPPGSGPFKQVIAKHIEVKD